jgi:hypothetical protein
VPIDDVDTPGSPGWWFRRLARQQYDRLPELRQLHKRYESDPPLPEGAHQARSAYQAFQKLARTNYEETVVNAVLDRQTPVGFRTAVGGDDGGDAAAAAMWAANEMPVQASDILESKLSMREGYAIVGPPDDDSDGQAVITAEDPRQVITAHDPVRPSRVRAALKLFWDPDEEQDVAYVYLPGRNSGEQAQAYRATRPSKSPIMAATFRFSPRAWTWDDAVAKVPTSRCPVVRFRNRRGGKAEFEKHVDLIDRIRHTILQRMVIITLQAYRQRAISGLPDRYPDDWPVEELRGQPIDYTDVFTADPAAVWMLPALPGPNGGSAMAQIWESGQLDLTPVLSAVKDDVRELATVTQTPFYSFMPDGANQTAEGAVTQREGINFKVEDHNTRDGIAFAQVMSLGFEMMDDPDRAKLGQLETLWAPVERFSLAAKADAAQKAKASGMSARMILTEIWQKTPQQAQRELDARAEDFLFAAQPPAPPAPQPAPGPVPAGG